MKKKLVNDVGRNNSANPGLLNEKETKEQKLKIENRKT